MSLRNFLVANEWYIVPQAVQSQEMSDGLLSEGDLGAAKGKESRTIAFDR